MGFHLCFSATMGWPLEVTIALDTVKCDNYKKRPGLLDVSIALDTAKHYNYKLPRQHEGSNALDTTHVIITNIQGYLRLASLYTQPILQLQTESIASNYCRYYNKLCKILLRLPLKYTMSNKSYCLNVSILQSIKLC